MAKILKKIGFTATFVVVVLFALGILALIDTHNSINAEKLAAKEAAAATEWANYENMLDKADKLYQGYFYDEAIGLLQNSDYAKREQAIAKIASYKIAKSSLVKYDGVIEHIFFHSLIVYPKLAFDGDHMSAGYNLWMTTASEFKKMLPELRAKGYVLYNIEDLIAKDPSDLDKIILKDIYLPKGKKPLIISVDDVSYYDYMKKDGFAERLVLDKNGDVATLVKSSKGIEEVTRTGDVVPILDDFVKEYPDFSYKGAKGILALTGYAGALGYRITDVTGNDYLALRKQMDPVVAKLKETGWEFACHSYTHNSYFRNRTISMTQMISDTTRWRDTIGKVVGQTNIYISPFGVSYKNNDPLYRYLVEDQGFNIFCTVEAKARLTTNADNIVMTRINLDGFSMKNHIKMLNERFFDVSKVIDKARPE